MSLLDTMKQVAGQTQNANVPAAFMFGTVTKTSPLTIRVDNRFDISGDAIVLMKEFKAGAIRPTPTQSTHTPTSSLPIRPRPPAKDRTHTKSARSIRRRPA